MESPLLVVIVTYNSVGVVGTLLDSMPAALAGVSAEVVVVDNESGDGTVELVSARDDIRVIASLNNGYASGINRGYREYPEAPAVLILNPDVVLEPDSVPVMLEALKRPGVGIVAPAIRDGQGALHPSLRREPNMARNLGLSRTGLATLSEYVSDPDDYLRPTAVDWALGAVLLVSHECWAAVGPWDESFFLYSEETDFCLRARDAGFSTWYEPKAGAVHIGGGSGQSDATHAMQILNRVRLYRRRHAMPSATVYYGLTILSELSWFFRGARKSRFALLALLRPSRRPVELGCSDRLIPK